jgi:tetratricopeptide (TPR) repeat protein
MRKSLLILLILSFVSQLRAQNLRDPEFMKQVQIGFTDIYNMDYAEAKRFFTSLEKQYPYHPAPPLYLASNLWLEELLRRQDLELSRFVSPTYFSKKTNQEMPPQERASFFSYLQKSESLSNAILAKNRQDKDGRYFLATVDGLQCTFAITIDHSLWQAFRHGNKAYTQCKQLVEEDPNYYDAYLTVGLYEYVVGSIPWYWKWMALMIGAHGKKKDGLEHLALASEKAQYNKNESQVIETVLYVREGQFSKSLAIARSLADRFPRNFLFPIEIAQTLQWSGQKDSAATMLLKALKRVETGEPNFDKVPLQKFRYNCAVELMNSGKWDLAQEQFVKSVNDPRTQEREKALSHLHLGQILEKNGKRNQAAQEYQMVLSLKEFEDSHDQAKRSLKNPESNNPR